MTTRNDSPQNITVMMSGDDLVEFADILIRRAKAEALAESSERERQEYLRGEEVQKLCKVCASTLVKWKACSYKFRGNPEFRLLEFAGIGSSGTAHTVDFCLLFSGVCKIEKFLYFCKPTMMATKTEQNGKHIWKTTC